MGYCSALRMPYQWTMNAYTNETLRENRYHRFDDYELEEWLAISQISLYAHTEAIFGIAKRFLIMDWTHLLLQIFVIGFASALALVLFELKKTSTPFDELERIDIERASLNIKMALGDSMRLETDEFEDLSTDSSTLAAAVRGLRGESVGATIVVIPSDKTMADYSAYLLQSVPVSLEVCAGSLTRIFDHDSTLHDGAIFVRNDRIIAAKAFFKLTGDTLRNSVSIGFGTRHASAKEFSQRAFQHRPTVLVLSEEDGQLRSCVDGKLRRISVENIDGIIAEQQNRGDGDRTTDNIDDSVL